MTVKYALFNPDTGLYDSVDTLDELRVQLAKRATEFYLNHTHQAPYSVVTTTAEGVEQWTTPQGEQMLSPQAIEALIEGEVQQFIESNP